MDITELVKRGFDTRAGGETEAESARNALRRRVLENPETRDLRIWHGDSQTSPNIMDLLAEYKRPTELKISQLERELKRKDKYINELKEQLRAGGATTVSSFRLNELEEIVRQRDEEIAALKSQLQLSTTSRTEKVSHSSRTTRSSSDYVWTSADYREAITLLMQKKGNKGVMERFPDVRSGQIDGKLRNQAPDEKLLGYVIPVLESGPMDFMELWKIGSSLYGTGWRKELERRLNLTWRSIGFDPPNFLTEDQCRNLRDAYRNPSRPLKLSPKATEVLERIRASGADGLIIENDGHQRLQELRDKKLIFDSGKRGGKTGLAILWVAAEEKDRYPEQWAALA